MPKSNVSYFSNIYSYLKSEKKIKGFETNNFVKCILYQIDYIGFLFLKAEIQAFFAAKTDHIWMVIKAPEIPHLVCAKNNR